MSNEHITDEQINGMAKARGIHDGSAAVDLVRAIFALRPAAQPVAAPDRVPMTINDIQLAFLAAPTNYFRAFSLGIAAAEAHHGITTPKATSP